MQVVPTTSITPLWEVLALEIGQIFSVSTATELDTPMIGVISFMVIQPPQNLQEERAQDLQQMCMPLRMIRASVRKLLIKEDKSH